MLSKEQLRFFEVFGYLKFPGVMNDRLEQINEEFKLTFDTNTVISKHDGTKRSCIVPFIDQREYMCSLLDDPRVNEIAVSLLGENFNYMGSDGNYYTGSTAWHRDGRQEKYRHIKIAFYLDKLDGNSGALRVVPGSHRLNDQFAEDLNEIARSRENWGVGGDEVPAQALDVTPGDLLVFDHNIMHSSWNGNSIRRMFTINLCERYKDEDTQELRDNISGLSRFWVDRVYGDMMINTASPSRLKHLEQVMANDGHLAELSARARLEMPEPSRG